MNHSVLIFFRNKPILPIQCFQWRLLSRPHRFRWRSLGKSYVGYKFEILSERLFTFKTSPKNESVTQILKLSPSSSHQHHCCQIVIFFYLTTVLSNGLLICNLVGWYSNRSGLHINQINYKYKDEKKENNKNR